MRFPVSGRGGHCLGMSLWELLWVVTLAGLVVGFSTVAVGRWSTQVRLRTATNTLVEALWTARSLAVTHNAPAILCMGEPDRGCTRDQANKGGMILFVDRDYSGTLSEDEPPFRVWPTGWADTLHIEFTHSLDEGIRFLPSGAPARRNGAFLAGTIQLCAKSGESRKVIISRQGRIRTERNHQNGSCGLRG